ncbi:MAG TPA: SIR2 family protein [Bryobacteraceae bacterium]
MGSIAVPADLVQRTLSGRCVAVIGSGPSQNAGIPGWRGALRKIVTWAGEQGFSLADLDEIQRMLDDQSADLLTIAAELFEQLGKTRYRHALAAVFRPGDVRPTAAHGCLATIPFAGIITTNYDKLMEIALTTAGIDHIVLTQQQPAELNEVIGGDRFFLLKAHGDIDNIDTVVLGTKDYQKLLLNNAYQSCISHIFSQYTVLFVGFSLTDPDLQLTLNMSRAVFEGNTPNHYAVIEKPGPINARRFQRDHGITLLPYERSDDTHPEVGEFLRELREKVSEKRTQQPQVVIVMEAQRSAAAELEELERERGALGPAEHLRRLVGVCQRLWQDGARKQAWTSVIGPFGRHAAALPNEERVRLSVEVSIMAIEDAGPMRAAELLRDLQPIVDQLGDSQLQFSFWDMWARCLLGIHDLQGAKAAIDRAIAVAPGHPARLTIEARGAEACLLSGRLREVTDFRGT